MNTRRPKIVLSAGALLLILAFPSLSETVAETTIASVRTKTPPADTVVPGSALRPAMGLIYAANGQRSDPWIVEAVETGLAHGGMSNCSRIQFQLKENESQPDVRWQCVDKKILYEHNKEAGRWQPSRPIGPKMTLELRGPDGSVATRYVTDGLTYEAISGLDIGVVRTTVYTLKNGAVIRRLRERYATAFGTATGGVFEMPDRQSEDGWRRELEFELVEITGK